jgi:hypothetical protein
MKQMRTYVLLALIGLLLAACGASDTAETTTTSSAAPTTVAGVTTTSSPGEPAVHPGLTSRVALAVADLSERLAVPESEIEVVSAQPVTWPDSSLGCPEPGMQYAQVLTDGALIELESAGTSYSYHMGGSTYVPFLCETPVLPQKSTGTTLDPEGPVTTITRDDLKPDPTDQSVPPPRYDD